MKTVKIVISLILFLIGSCYANNSQPRIIDVKKILIAHGFEDGVFFGSKDIGTIESFLINDFLIPDARAALSDENEKIVEEELPYNNEGLLRLLSMLLLRTAAYPDEKTENMENIHAIIQIVKKETSHKIHTKNKIKAYKFPALNVTEEEVINYYRQAIKNKIAGIKIKELNTDEITNAKELLYNYCVEPLDKNREKIIIFNKSLNSSIQKQKAFHDFIQSISEELFINLFSM